MSRDKGKHDVYVLPGEIATAIMTDRYEFIDVAIARVKEADKFDLPINQAVDLLRLVRDLMKERAELKNKLDQHDGWLGDIKGQVEQAQGVMATLTVMLRQATMEEE